MNKEKGYHVLSMEIVNNKKIELFQINLKGKHLEIAGPVGIGKTTASSAFWNVLKAGADQITHGEDKSVISIILSNGKDRIEATRTYTSKTAPIKIIKIPADGRSTTIRANEFKDMLSPLSADPHKIKSMSGKDRIALLLPSAGIPEEVYSSLDTQIERAEVVMQDARKHQHDFTPGNKIEKPEIIENLASAIDKANTIANEYNEKEAAVANAEASIRVLSQSIEYKQDAVQQAMEELKRKQLILQQEKIALAKDKKQLAKRQADLSKAIVPTEGRVAELVAQDEEHKSKMNAYNTWKDLVLADDEAKKKYKQANEILKALRDKKKALIDEADFPLEGLSIKDGDLVYNDMLVDNLGESEKMLVYSSLAIEDASNYPLKLVRVDGIESMGKKDFDLLKEHATNNGVQLFSTRVTWDETIQDSEITIVDGKYTEEDE